MPWKECHVMDERVRFVARRLEGESMAALCAEFGLAEDRLQDLRTLQRLRCHGADGSQSTTLSAGQSAAGAGGSDDCPVEARVSRLGGTEDSREAAPAADWPRASAGHQHGARGAGSLRAGETPPAAPPQRGGHVSLATDRAQC